MRYWYPAQQRVTELTAELRALEQVAAGLAADAQAYIPAISSTLSQAAASPGFPVRQVPQWIWIASQFRLHAAQGGPIALTAGSALTYLNKLAGRPVSEEEVQDLNWVLESSVQRLSELVPPSALRSCLSAEEMDRIEQRLTQFTGSDFDVVQIRQAVSAQTAQLRALSGENHLNTLEAKLEALFGASAHDDDGGRVARAALLYLADEHDVVSDTDGFLGLLDDIYVVEWAYAVVENQTRCLPLLRSMLQVHPFVADLAMIGSPPKALDIYSQYVACAVLEALYRAQEPFLLVLRDAGPYGSICAFAAAVEAARRQARRQGEELAAWSVGQDIVISDGTVALKAIYKGKQTVGSREVFRLGVRDSGTVTVPLEVMPYMAKVGAPHRRLSSGNDVMIWLKSRRPDPLVNLTGAGRTRNSGQECVLLLGPRHKLDDYLAALNPMNVAAAALVGVRYVTGEGRQEDLRGTATDTPFIYACSDADMAYELIRSPPSHVGRWRVVVDGARAGRALRGALTSDGEGSPPLCVLAELHDRETASDLLRQGLSVWYLEDQDVEAPPLTPRRPSSDDDALVRALTRQSNHWVAAKRMHPLDDPFLDAVDAWMRRASVEARHDDILRGLEFLVSAFVQTALAKPFASPQSNEALSSLARQISMQAHGKRMYSEHAAELFALFKPIADGEPRNFERTNALRFVAEGIAEGESVAVVCRSSQIAAECGRLSEADPDLGRLSWMNMEALRRTAPYDRVLVPGWLDRFSMRELANNGYGARLDLILYPFEQRWFERTMAANGAWERRIEGRSRSTLTSLVERLRESDGAGVLWREEAAKRLRDAPTAQDIPEAHDESDTPEYETLEARTIEEVHRVVMQGRSHQPTAKAQLVLFETPGAYAYLPPTGKVIVLAGRGDELRPNGGADAERMLFRSVASLEPGFLLALPLSGDRDLVDARADAFIKEAADVRRLAALWKTALARHLGRDGLDPASFARRLKNAGHERHSGTVRYWVSGSHTVAPRGYKELIGVIARLTGDDELLSKIPEVLGAIETVYKARALAAEAIVKELFAGAIDLTADELCFEAGNAKIRYVLHRVRRLEGLFDVPHDVIGRAGSLAAGAFAAPTELVP